MLYLVNFNPLPLYRGRQDLVIHGLESYEFQSTSSIQRKTSLIILDIFRKSISIHFLYTEEDSHRVACFRVQFISIHFLYTEEDVMDNDKTIKETDFNPLPLYRGRLIRDFILYIVGGISIHFLYTEEDSGISLSGCSAGYFNPLPLYRGRHL